MFAKSTFLIAKIESLDDSQNPAPDVNWEMMEERWQSSTWRSQSNQALEAQSTIIGITSSNWRMRVILELSNPPLSSVLNSCYGLTDNINNSDGMVVSDESYNRSVSTPLIHDSNRRFTRRIDNGTVNSGTQDDCTIKTGEQIEFVRSSK
ncbi:hypothetical protein [Pseudoteredinibacter isoporae]|uniref:Uncharacterized protein n=1 Tax=Pseudoteredinibacter isoporae TaxID=570281 RepID=A0A7X0JT78_9GAMM|nr:hypothetical protein [Pseudoteredinibacter isoporae]MBB6521273.1 hypothetical protein [Pseudoteredinibacter isoporae]NHO86831.1 hypothetical protein [Pseudoteredinibacter isoporae]NIB24717.1 hypothetical protein [Pseudoteredinibacter isoporae]